MEREIELKLEFDPDAASLLMESELVPKDVVIIDQRSVYFDTPDHDLAGSRFALRVRHVEGKRIQTLKAADTGAAGLFARPEWERAIDADTPILDETDPLRGIFREKLDTLMPIFEIRVERRRWIVARHGSVIELVVDRGEVIAGDRRSPISEIELELKCGSAGELFAMAREIDRIVPVRPSVLSKNERGYRLLGPSAPSVEAESVGLGIEMTAAAAFQKIAGACVKHYRLNQVLIGLGNGEPLHQARVALRRLRSALSIHKPMLADDAFDRLSVELRWLASELGNARDVDVLLSRAETPALREKLHYARDEAYRNVEQTLVATRTRALMIDLSEWLAVGGWLSDHSRSELRNEPVADFAASALERYRRKVKKRGRGLAGLDDETRHRLRKDAKKLRYAAEFFAALFDARKPQKRRHARFVKTLGTMQDKLGVLNDASSAEAVLCRLGLDKADGAVKLLDVSERKADLLEEAADAYAEFVDAKRFWR